MEDDQMEEEVEFPPERIEPFAKMSQLSVNPPERDMGIPVKFRRNLFEGQPVGLPPPDEPTANGQMVFHKPGHHMRAQPRVPYSSMDPEQRKQAEILDTAVARQQLLLRQQQEVLTYAHRQQVEQQAQQLVNNALVVSTTNTTPVNRQMAQPQPYNDRQRLNALLNEACVLAPQQQPMMNLGGVSWASNQPYAFSSYSTAPVSVLANQPPVYVTAGLAPPGAPGGLMMMGQEELMQAVRKELKRMQQD